MKSSFSQMMLENTHPTILLRRDGSIIECNDEMMGLLGVDGIDDIRGVNYLDTFISELERPGIEADIARVLDGFPTWGYRNSYLGKDGIKHEKYWSAVKHPFIENALVAWASDLDSKSIFCRQLHAFLQVLSHNLSTPISALNLLVDSIEGEFSNDEAKALFRKSSHQLSCHIEVLRVFNQVLIEKAIKFESSEIGTILGVGPHSQLHQPLSKVCVQPSLIFLLQNLIAEITDDGGIVDVVNSVGRYALKIDPQRKLHVSAMSMPLLFHLLKLVLSLTEAGDVVNTDDHSGVVLSFELVA